MTNLKFIDQNINEYATLAICSYLPCMKQNMIVLVASKKLTKKSIVHMNDDLGEMSGDRIE